MANKNKSDRRKHKAPPDQEEHSSNTKRLPKQAKVLQSPRQKALPREKQNKTKGKLKSVVVSPQTVASKAGRKTTCRVLLKELISEAAVTEDASSSNNNAVVDLGKVAVVDETEGYEPLSVSKSGKTSKRCVKTPEKKSENQSKSPKRGFSKIVSDLVASPGQAANVDGAATLSTADVILHANEEP